MCGAEVQFCGVSCSWSAWDQSKQYFDRRVAHFCQPWADYREEVVRGRENIRQEARAPLGVHRRGDGDEGGKRQHRDEYHIRHFIINSVRGCHDFFATDLLGVLRSVFPTQVLSCSGSNRISQALEHHRRHCKNYKE